MRKKISFVILSNSGAPVKQVCTSKASIRLFGIFLFALMICFGYVIYDYYTLKRTSLVIKQKESQISHQLVTYSDEIKTQRKQIQEFATEITALKNKLVAINGFEKQIRVIANLGNADESENIFGVGGSTPEDIDPQIPLTEKHNSLMRQMHDQIEQLELAATNQQAGLESLLSSLQDQQNLLASTPAIRPIARKYTSWTTSRFGYRISPFTQRREFHKAYDISAASGTPILATADGVVTFAGKKGLLGNCIIINHGHGMVTRYGHCSKLLKKRGDKVDRWESIALVGNTGRSTGPHVHYEVHLNGIPVNPEKYILN